MPDIEELRADLLFALADEPPLNLRDGGVFKPGCNANLDAFRHLLTDGQQMLLDLEAKERKDAGIPSLKIKYTGFLVTISRLLKLI